MLVRRWLRPSSVARDAGGRGRGPAAIRLNAWPIGLLMRVRRARAAAPHLELPFATPHRSVEAAPAAMPAGRPPSCCSRSGAPRRLMPSLQLQGHLQYVRECLVTGCPCRLQAVIRRLAAHGQRDLGDVLGASLPHRQRDARAPHTPTVERGARCRRARPRTCGGRRNAWPIGLLMHAVGTQRPRRTPTPCCHASSERRGGAGRDAR